MAGGEGPLWPTASGPAGNTSPGGWPGATWGPGPVPTEAPWQGPGGPEGGLGPNTRCYEHSDRLAGALCRGCGKPICGDCMVEAPVGWHCRRCVRRAQRTSPVVRYRPGGSGVAALGRAPLTVAVIAACAVLYIASSSHPSLLDQAADWGALVHQGQWWRLFTAIFFHVDFLHIALNMVALWVIGRILEPVLGTWRYGALFLLSGLGGSVSSYLLSSPLSGSVGASGAIFGLFGAYFVLARRAAADTTGIVVLIAVNLVFSFTVSGISWQGHIGGLVTGLVVAAGFGLGRGWRSRRLGTAGRRAEVVADAGVVALVSLALALLMLLPPGVANLG